MAQAMSKQDLQSVVDAARSRIVDRMLSKSDVQIACESARDRIIGQLQDVKQDTLIIAKATATHNEQAARKSELMAARLQTIEQEVRFMRQAMDRLLADSRKAGSAFLSLEARMINMQSTSSAMWERAVN